MSAVAEKSIEGGAEVEMAAAEESEVEATLGRMVSSALLPGEADAVLEALREYPYEVTEEATAKFRDHLCLRLDRMERVPLLTESQESLDGLPEALGGYVARSIDGQRNYYSTYGALLGQAKRPSQLLLSAMEGYAIWEWDAKDEQILPMEAFLRFISPSHYLQPIASMGAIFITPLNVALASLAPGAEHSDFVAKAWSITQVLESQLQGKSWDDDRAVFGRWEEALTGLCFHEIHSTFGEMELKYEEFCTFTRIPQALEEECWGPLRFAFAPDAVRAWWLDELGAAFLLAVSGRVPEDVAGEARPYILGRYSGGGEWSSVLRGAEALLGAFPGHGGGFPGDPSVLLPLGFLCSLPSLDVASLGEFQALVEEYNVEWALAGFDWNDPVFI